MRNKKRTSKDKALVEGITPLRHSDVKRGDSVLFQSMLIEDRIFVGTLEFEFDNRRMVVLRIPTGKYPLLEERETCSSKTDESYLISVHPYALKVAEDKEYKRLDGVMEKMVKS